MTLGSDVTDSQLTTLVVGDAEHVHETIDPRLSQISMTFNGLHEGDSSHDRFSSSDTVTEPKEKPGEKSGLVRVQTNEVPQSNNEKPNDHEKVLYVSSINIHRMVRDTNRLGVVDRLERE